MKLSCLFVYESHQLTPPMEICGYTFTTQTTSIWKGYWTDILEFFSVFTLIMSFLIRRCNLENNHRAISPESWKEIRNRRVTNDFEKDTTCEVSIKSPLTIPCPLLWKFTPYVADLIFFHFGASSMALFILINSVHYFMKKKKKRLCFELELQFQNITFVYFKPQSCIQDYSCSDGSVKF